MDELELQVRVPFVEEDTEWLESLEEMVEAFGQALEAAEAGFIDDCEEEGMEICFYLYGADQEALVPIARGVLEGFGRLEGAYGVKTTPGKEDEGEGQRVAF